MDEEQTNAFNLGVDLYTELLFDQKELLFRIIDTSYRKGYEQAIKEIEIARITALRQAQEEAEEAEYRAQEQRQPQPTHIPQKDTHDTEATGESKSFADRLKSIRR